MKAPVNTLKQALKTNDMQLGIWLNLANPSTAEIAGAVGYDWLLIDGEHAPYEPALIQEQLRVLGQFDVAPIVRVPVFEPWIMKQVLDLGAQSLMVPMVNTAAQAKAVVASTRYAPVGVRGMGAGVARAAGFGHVDEYLDNANDEICLICQVETREAFENIDEIANTEGVDCIFIGPADLSADMGYPGNPTHPEVISAIKHIIAQTRKAGKAAGILDFDPKKRAEYEALGVNFLGVGSDANLLRLALKANLHDAAL
jgi:4-hydroxy-2-oxoheptanedioate aldolase